MIRHKIFTPLARLVGATFLLGASTFGQQAQTHAPMQPLGVAAPEIDVSLAGAAVALVLGGVLVATAIRRRRLSRT